MNATRILRGQIFLVSLVVLIFVWTATELTAWRLGFQLQLGAPWFELLAGPFINRLVKATIELPAAVHRELAVYDEALAQGTDKAIGPVKLIPPMLAHFMATDRAFAKLRRVRSKKVT